MSALLENASLIEVHAPFCNSRCRPGNHDFEFVGHKHGPELTDQCASCVQVKAWLRDIDDDERQA